MYSEFLNSNIFPPSNFDFVRLELRYLLVILDLVILLDFQDRELHPESEMQHLS
jgi:hypothetical protein